MKINERNKNRTTTFVYCNDTNELVGCRVNSTSPSSAGRPFLSSDKNVKFLRFFIIIIIIALKRNENKGDVELTLSQKKQKKQQSEYIRLQSLHTVCIFVFTALIHYTL